MQSVALNHIRSLDEPIGEKEIAQFARDAEKSIYDRGLIAQVQDRMSGEHSRDYYLGMLSGLAQARDIWRREPEPMSVGLLLILSQQLAKHLEQMQE
jgi:hypothetical protein